MKNNIIGFVVYLLATILLSPSSGVILLAMKENSDRCHYYGGKWNITDLAIGYGCCFHWCGSKILFWISYILKK